MIGWAFVYVFCLFGSVFFVFPKGIEVSLFIEEISYLLRTILTSQR